MIEGKCRTIPFRGERVFAAVEASSYRWVAGGGVAVVGASDQQRVTVRGNTTGQATLRLDAGGKQQTADLTVVDLPDVTVDLRATRPTRSNTASRFFYPDFSERDATFVSHEQAADFPAERDDTVLVLVRGSTDGVDLQTRATPHDTKIHWTVVRNPDDLSELHHERPPTLTHTEGAANRLTPDATGSFFVHAVAGCACGEWHPDLGRIVRLVLVTLTVTGDRTAVHQDYFAKDAVEGRPFNFAEMETEIASGENAITFDTDFAVLSGGPDGRLYLHDDERSAVSGVWCNTARPSRAGTELGGTYVHDQEMKTILVRPEHAPHVRTPVYTRHDPAPERIEPPFRDGYDDLASPADLRMSRASTVVENALRGQRWRATGEDSPNEVLPLLHPENVTATIEHLELDFEFVIAFCVWSVSAPWIIGAIAVTPWAIRAGWDIHAPRNITDRDQWKGNLTSRAEVMKSPSDTRTRPADVADVEVWTPGSLQHVAMITY